MYMGIASDGLRLEVADRRRDGGQAAHRNPPTPRRPASGNPICCACPEFKMGRLNRSEADLFLSMVSIYRVEKIGAPNGPCSRVAPSGRCRAEGATREHETFRGPIFSAR